MPAAQRLFEQRWYIDELYNKVFVGLAVAIAKLCYGTETKGFDGGADRIADGTRWGGKTVARSHIGRVQFYVGVACLILAAFVISMEWLSPN